MRAERVIDASVAAAAHFEEAGSAAAAAALLGGPCVAPELLTVEIASVAAKKLRRGEAQPIHATGALDALGEVVDTWMPNGPLLARAMAIAGAGPISLYDAVYLAAAEARGCAVLTLDRRLVRAAATAGLERLVEQAG